MGMAKPHYAFAEMSKIIKFINKKRKSHFSMLFSAYTALAVRVELQAESFNFFDIVIIRSLAFRFLP